MRRMSLDDDRATGRESRSGVAAGDRERQREIAGSENCYRTERHVAQSQVGARRRLAIRLGGLDSNVQE